MTSLLTGRICRLLFPFTDKDEAKRRPALALSEPDAFGDVCWAFITTKAHEGVESIPITPSDLAEGSLPRASHLFPDKVFTIHQGRIEHHYGTVTPAFMAALNRRTALASSKAFSLLAHTAQRPGEDGIRLAAGVPAASSVIPYAGRVFTEDEVVAAVSSTLDFWLTLGKEGEAFEAELAAFLGVRRSILTNSGSSANLLAFSALTSHKIPEPRRIRPGDEVITCAAGFPTTVAPIIQNGAVPVFLDNDPRTGNADLSRLEEAYVPGKTKAVMMAHALGNPFDLATVLAFCRRHDLWLIEDNCDALGCTYSLPLDLAKSLGLEHLIQKAEANVEQSKREISPTPQPFNPSTRIPFISNGMLTAYTGTFGDLSTQSFYPPHHLTMGEGGAINIVKDMKLKVLVESFRDWGRDCWCASGIDNTCRKRFGWQLGELPEGYDHKYIYSHLGYNLKPLDPQAAIGRVQLKKMPAFIEARKRNWQALRRGLVGLETVFEFSLPTHATEWRGGGNSPAGSVQEGWQEATFQWEGTVRTDPSWFGFMLLVRPEAPFTRTEFAQFLDAQKIGNRMLFGGNLVRQPAFVQLRRDNPGAFRVVGETPLNGGVVEKLKGSLSSTPQPFNPSSSPLPGADQIMNQAIFIGVYPGLSAAQIETMVRAIREFAHNTSGCRAP